MTPDKLLHKLRNRWRDRVIKPVLVASARASRAGKIARYLQSTKTPALILGAGSQLREGWLASDLDPTNGAIIPIDATRRLPFPDASLAYVFAEHMIEHIDYRNGQKLMREIYRVLRAGGVVRIATPDLVRTARLVVEPLDEAAQAYVDWNNTTFGEHVNNRPSFVLNRLMRWWGHQFVYDQPTLVDLMKEAGFVAIEAQQIGESPHVMLRHIEHHGDIVSEMANRFETMVIEGTKPAAAS